MSDLDMGQLRLTPRDSAEPVDPQEVSGVVVIDRDRLKSAADRERQAHQETVRTAELCALRERTLADARTAAEARANTAEIAAQLEHARLLAAVCNDPSTKRLRAIAIGVGLLAFLIAGGGGAVVKATADQQVRIEREAARLRAEADRIEGENRRVRAEREAAEADKIAALERKVKDAERAVREARKGLSPKGKRPLCRPGGPQCS